MLNVLYKTKFRISSEIQYAQINQNYLQTLNQTDINNYDIFIYLNLDLLKLLKLY